MALEIKNKLTLRTQKSSKLTLAKVDQNFIFSETQTQAATNTLTYLGPSPSFPGWTISNTRLIEPGPQRFNGRISSGGPEVGYYYNYIGGNWYMADGVTISFQFSGTSSGYWGASPSFTYDWWTNLSNSYSNKVLSLSSQYTPDYWEYRIHSITYSNSTKTWGVVTTKLSGPTSSDVVAQYLYTVGYRTLEPPNSSYIYGWSASMPMVGGNFPNILGTFSPKIISTNDYILSINSATVQFKGATGHSGTYSTFYINLLAGSEVFATGTFSGKLTNNPGDPYNYNINYRTRPTGVSIDGGSVITITGKGEPGWGGINFGYGASASIAIFLTYQKFANAETGLDPIE